MYELNNNKHGNVWTKYSAFKFIIKAVKYVTNMGVMLMICNMGVYLLTVTW